MRVSGNTILIAGGASGIGLALAKAFLDRGNTVIVCGRRKEKLDEVRQQLPELLTLPCDLASFEGRRELFRYCTKKYPDLNILVNNAGIQRIIDFQLGEADYLSDDSEVSINLEAPLHLTALFVPHLTTKPESAVVNVTSGLGLVPLISAPVYSATKAAMHSVSMSLRRQLRKTTVKVFEILPPIVETELHNRYRERRGGMPKGISAGKVAADSLRAMERDRFQVFIGMNKLLALGARIALGMFLNLINKTPS